MALSHRPDERGCEGSLLGYPIRMQTLRECPTDIPILIRRYFPSVEFEEESLEILCRYNWPGNVRQLISTVERMAAKAGGGRIITTEHVRREIDLERKSALAPSHADSFLSIAKITSLFLFIHLQTSSV